MFSAEDLGVYIRSVDICSVVVWSYAGGSGGTAANWVKMKFTLPILVMVRSGGWYAHRARC